MANSSELAALLIPVLALIVVSAVDSVQEDDSPWYRAIVAGLGISSLGPVIVVVAHGISSSTTEIQQGYTRVYAVFSLFLIFLLILAVVMKETRRGMRDPSYTYDHSELIYLGMMVLVGLWYLTLFVVF